LELFHNESPLGTIYLVGGGPSLQGFDFTKLAGKPTIAINRAHEQIPDAGIIYFADLRFWQWNQAAMLAHPGTVITGCKHITHPDVLTFRITGKKGLDLNPWCLRTGNNGGYAAINLAAHIFNLRERKGTCLIKRIVLLGFDMKTQDGNHHWHDGYKVQNKPAIYDKMIDYFATIVGPLKDQGIEVINTSMDSRIDVFEKREFDQL